MGAYPRWSTMRALRVLHVIDSLWGGGAEMSLVFYVHAVGQERGVEHRVVALRGDKLTREAATGLPVPAVVGSPRPGPQWSDAALVRTQVAEFRPDLVTSTLVRATFAAGRALAGSRVPLLVALTSVAHDVDDVHGSVKRRVGIRLSHAAHGFTLRRRRVSIRAVSRPVAERAIGMFRLDPEAVFVVPDLRPDLRSRVTAGRAALRHRLGVAEHSSVLAYTAREHPIKDHATLLAAVARLLDDRPSLRLLLAGPSGAATDAIDRAVERLGLGRAVLRLGLRDDVPDLLAAADLFVSSSMSEGLGASVIEAMGMGLPVVAVDNPGIREVLGGRHPGLVPAGDEIAMADRVKKFLDDESLSSEASRIGSARFRETFDVSRNAWRHEEVFRRAIDRYPRASGGRAGST
ncbi:MAG TPA: glycosyltransferase [Acidimicrobiia bacterium]|nr:glycosyltransferase [Acidimicrobiia bacterium]